MRYAEVRMNSVYNLHHLETLCRDAYSRKRFCNAWFKKGFPAAACLELVPEYRLLAAPVLQIAERHDSKTDGATKLVFHCVLDGAKIEAVILRISSGRTSLCISSQVGCAANCEFCATGAMGFVRNLSVAEILEQVVLARRLLREEGRDLRNVVFMGMGEPLHNEENLMEALDRLRDPRFFYFSENHLMVSTVGVPDAMERFVARFPNIRLALSLHSARQETREQLMPIARAQTLERLRPVLRTMGTQNPPMVEYLLLKGVNDGPDDLRALIGYLDGIAAHINLIQFNPYPNAPFQPVSKEEREVFSDALKAAGFKVTLRYSLGDDIAAACGQLAGR